MRKVILLILISVIILGSLRLFYSNTVTETHTYQKPEAEESEQSLLQTTTSAQTNERELPQREPAPADTICDNDDLAFLINAIFLLENLHEATCLHTLVTKDAISLISPLEHYRLLLILYWQGQWRLLTTDFTAVQLQELLSGFVTRTETLDFLKAKGIDSETFVTDVLAQVNSQTLLALLTDSQNLSINLLTLHTLLAKKPILPLAEIWPVASSAQWSDNKEATLEHLIRQFLATDREATITYLHDHYWLSEDLSVKEQSRVRGYDFAKILNTLHAWQNNTLAGMSPEQYDSDASLVIEHVGNLLSHDIQHFTNQLNELSGSELLPKVIASTMQSEQFFQLNDDQLLTLLGQLPQDISKALAHAYSLQLQYSEEENKTARQQLLQRYL